MLNQSKYGSDKLLDLISWVQLCVEFKCKMGMASCQTQPSWVQMRAKPTYIWVW